MTRVAMLSVHACPLAKLGGRDSGGMNVYVRELARDLGARGIEVDVFTRWRERYDPRIQQLGPNARVIHVESGPIGYWPKMAVYEHLDQFGEKLLEHVAAEGKGYDLVHAHYWLSAKVARTLAGRESMAPRLFPSSIQTGVSNESAALCLRAGRVARPGDRIRAGFGHRHRERRLGCRRSWRHRRGRQPGAD